LIEAVGLKVSRLIRTRFGPFSLPPQLKRGQIQELDDKATAQLLAWAGQAASVAPARVQRRRGPQPGRPPARKPR
jgi:23S rRNA pseudouridine2605 synthase